MTTAQGPMFPGVNARRIALELWYTQALLNISRGQMAEESSVHEVLRRGAIRMGTHTHTHMWLFVNMRWP